MLPCYLNNTANQADPIVLPQQRRRLSYVQYGTEPAMRNTDWTLYRSWAHNCLCYPGVPFRFLSIKKYKIDSGCNFCSFWKHVIHFSLYLPFNAAKWCQHKNFIKVILYEKYYQIEGRLTSARGQWWRRYCCSCEDAKYQ